MLRIKLIVLAIVVAFLGAIAPVSAHSPACIAKYPHIWWRDYYVTSIIDPVHGHVVAHLVDRTYINVNTGLKHSHRCVRQV